MSPEPKMKRNRAVGKPDPTELVRKRAVTAGVRLRRDSWETLALFSPGRAAGLVWQHFFMTQGNRSPFRRSYRIPRTASLSSKCEQKTQASDSPVETCTGAHTNDVRPKEAYVLSY